MILLYEYHNILLFNIIEIIILCYYSILYYTIIILYYYLILLIQKHHAWIGLCGERQQGNRSVVYRTRTGVLGTSFQYVGLRCQLNPPRRSTSISNLFWPVTGCRQYQIIHNLDQPGCIVTCLHLFRNTAAIDIVLIGIPINDVKLINGRGCLQIDWYFANSIVRNVVMLLIDLIRCASRCLRNDTIGKNSIV